MKPKHTCTQQMSNWSPALEIFNDDEMTEQRFVGRLREITGWRRPPSPTIDALWDDITYPEGGLVRLSKEELERINAPEYAAQYTEDMEGGYIAGIEVLHQLHCLNMMRKTMYLDYYLPKMKEWRDNPETLKYHLDMSAEKECLMVEPN
jgi:hypothetical protein